MEHLDLMQQYKDDPAFDHLKQDAFFVPGRGPTGKPKLMLVGEAPGRMENAKRIPFVGPAGRALKMLLKDSGIDMDDVYITNVLKFWPQDPPTVTRPPTEEEIEACRPYIIKEIEAVNPSYVGLMGLAAIKTLYPDVTNVYELNGTVLDGRFIPLYHPAVMLYPSSAGRRKQLEDGYKELGRIIRRV